MKDDSCGFNEALVAQERERLEYMYSNSQVSLDFDFGL